MDAQEGRSLLPPSKRNQDPARQAAIDALTALPARPLTREEEEAAETDPGRRERTCAPQSARVPKPPAPGDREVLEGRRGRADAERLGLSRSDERARGLEPETPA